MSTSLEDPRLTEHVTLPTGEKSTLSFKHSHTGLSCVLTKSLQLSVTAALTAPWLPAPTTLTTAALVWRLQCRTWGTMTMKTSTTRTMMKTKAFYTFVAPTSTVLENNFSVGIYFPPSLVCASSTPTSLPPHARFPLWLSQGCT